MTLTVRSMEVGDVPACVRIVNFIIRKGGSTAYEQEFTEDSFRSYYLETPPVTNVAYSGDRLVGFQAAFSVGSGLYSIGSFADQEAPVKGTGRALFDKTLADCRAQGGDAILAKITSDNTAGLAYYARLGFEDFDLIKDDHQRPDGTKVDRIIKRFALD